MVALIVSEYAWESPVRCVADAAIVEVRLGFAEVVRWQRVKQAAGQ